MDKAGRNFLQSLILKNSGIQFLAHIYCAYNFKDRNPHMRHLLTTVLFCSKPLPKQQLQYLVQLMTLELTGGVDQRTIQNHDNATSAFKDLKPQIEKKQTASNRWEAREVLS